jgi:hypothetical protein
MSLELELQVPASTLFRSDRLDLTVADMRLNDEAFQSIDRLQDGSFGYRASSCYVALDEPI